MRLIGLSLICLFMAFEVQAEFSNECSMPTKNRIRSCFAGETLVSIPGGQKEISNLKLGDEVLAMAENGKIVISHVTGLFVHSKRRTCTLTTSDGKTVRITPEHVVMYVQDSVESADTASSIDTDHIGALKKADLNYTPAWYSPGGVSMLKMSEAKEGSSIQAAERIKIQSYKDPQLETVYNIEVESYHNYFANGLLVHNMK